MIAGSVRSGGSSPSGGGLVAVRSGYVSSGNLVPQDTAGGWAPITGGPTLTVPASVGDWIEFDLNCLIKPASNNSMDLAIVVGGSLVRYGATGTSTPAVDGDGAFYNENTFLRRGCAFGLEVASGDLDGGSVNCVLAVKAPAASSAIVYAAAYPLRWIARNYGGGLTS